jgi:hypothetical protein
MTLEQLEAERAAMLDPLDIPGTWTPRQRETYETQRCILDNRIREARTDLATLADLEPRDAFDTKWVVDLTAIRQQVGDELLSAPTRPRDDLARGRILNLELSIRTIDSGRLASEHSGFCLETLRVGQLLRERGYRESAPVENQVRGVLEWHGCVPEVEARMAERRVRLNDARQQLAAALHEPVLTTS